MALTRPRSLPLGGAVLALALSGCATTPPAALEQFSLGRNAGGDPCTAAYNWTDPSFGTVVGLCDALGLPLQTAVEVWRGDGDDRIAI